MPCYINNFSVSVCEVPMNAPLFSLEDYKELLDIKSDKGLFDLNASVIIADPFLFVFNDILYLFYEHQTKWFGKGRICMRYTKDLITWSDEYEVLCESFHLSFPYVFEDHGSVYMLPETGESRSVILYKALDDTLTKWRPVSTLLDNDNWYDSVIHFHNGKYYLFTGHDDNVRQVQHLFVSDNLIGPYVEHHDSPICEGRDRGRNAGPIVDCNGDIYRPVQVCVNSYGEQITIMHVDELSPMHYCENVFQKNIINTSCRKFRNGGHQYSSVYYKGRRIVAIDYREKNYNIIEFIRRINYKLKG